MFKNQTFHIIRFLLVYAILNYSFYAYIGLVSPGGKGYSAWLDQYANVPAWLTYGICQCAKGFLQLCGYDVYQKNLNTINIVGSRGVNIIWACLGWGVMSFWTAFVVAHVASIKYKLKWIAIGVVSIILINILRIALIALANHHDWKVFKSVEPHFAFNVVSYTFIAGLTLLFIKKYRRHRAFEKRETERISSSNVAAAV